MVFFVYTYIYDVKQAGHPTVFADRPPLSSILHGLYQVDPGDIQNRKQMHKTNENWHGYTLSRGIYMKQERWLKKGQPVHAFFTPQCRCHGPRREMKTWRNSQSSNPNSTCRPRKKSAGSLMKEVYDSVSLYGETTKSSCTGLLYTCEKSFMRIAFIWRSQHHRWHREYAWCLRTKSALYSAREDLWEMSENLPP